MFTLCAYAGLLGIDVEQMLNGSPLDLAIRRGIVQRALELKEEFDERLALKIINRLSESLNKGSS